MPQRERNSLRTLPVDFKRLMFARMFFTLAVQIQAVVMGWKIYDLTRDPLALGLVGLAEAVPALSLALHAGYWVDRGHPVKIYRFVLVASLVSSLILFFSARYGFYMRVDAQVSILYFASVISGIARAFSSPSIFAIVPKLVPRESLALGAAWMSSTMQVARVAGPALGGMIFGFFNAEAAFLVVSLCLMFGLGLCFQIRMNFASKVGVDRAPFSWSELISGAVFVFRHPILFPALSLDMISVMFGGVTALLPIFAREILLVGPKGLGLLRAAPAVGATLMSFYLTRVHLKHRAGTWLLSSVAGFGLSILVFALSKNFFLSLLALGLSGLFDSGSMVIRNAAVQLASPDALRGRISAVNSMFIGSSNELGEFESGVAAKLLGPVPAAYVGAIICLLMVSSMALFFPSLRKLDLEKI